MVYFLESPSSPVITISRRFLLSCCKCTTPAISASVASRLGLPGLEHFFHAGQTLRDILAGGHAAGVEGTHGELRARLADGLRGDDAHRFAHIHQVGRWSCSRHSSLRTRRVRSGR